MSVVESIKRGETNRGAKEAQWFERGVEVHGEERWQLIELALREATTLLALVNRFLPAETQRHARTSQQLVDHEEIPLVCECPGGPPGDMEACRLRGAGVVVDEDEGRSILPRSGGGGSAARRGPEAEATDASLAAPLLPCAFISGSSALAALALTPARGEKVLDLCAGPGAKALVLANALLAPPSGGEGQGAAEAIAEVVPAEATEVALEPVAAPLGGFVPLQSEATGLLVCNEPDRARAALLREVLAAFVPAELLARKGGAVVVTSSEGSHKAPPALQRHAPYDKVLVDVPCSALRRLAKEVRKKSGLNQVSRGMWECNARTVKANAELAEELLRCAGSLVRPGGLIVYCTSSLEARENDEVVKKFLQRVREDFRVEAPEEDVPIGGAECTEYGTMILPDQGTLHGPLYLARLRRSS